MISYLILVHNNQDQLHRLIGKLHTPNARFFIHVDSKTDILPFVDRLSEFENIFFADNRIDVRWGDYSVVEAYVELLKVVCKIAPDSYIIHLSGQDYPLRSNRYIENFIEQNNDSIFIRHFALPAPDWEFKGGLGRVFGHWYRLNGRRVVCIMPFDFGFSNLMVLKKIAIRKPMQMCKAVAQLFVKRKYPFGDITHYGGEFWMSMPAHYAEKILRTMDQNPAVERYYRLCGHPDEIMIQTLVMRDKVLHQKVVNRCLKYIDWSGKRGQLPLTLSIEEKDDIMRALDEPSVLFARKFDVNFDFQVMDYIDKNLLND